MKLVKYITLFYPHVCFRCVLKKEYTIIANVLHLEPIASSEEEEEEKEDCDTYDDFVTKTVPCNLDDMEDW